MPRHYEVHVNSTGYVSILELGDGDGPYAIREHNTATEIGQAETLDDARNMVQG